MSPAVPTVTPSAAPPASPTVTAAALPTNGPCGFASCLSAQRTGASASCAGSAFPSVVATEIDGSIDIGGSACDGNYLVLDLAHRTCATTGPTPCTNALGLAFFVAEDGKWTLITYGKNDTCAFVARTLEQPRLPSSLCTEALK